MANGYNHIRAAELHDIAQHAHAKSAVAHEKQDHKTGHERSQKALEHSEAAFYKSVEAHQEAAKEASLSEQKP